MQLPDLLTARDLRHAEVDALTRVILGSGWIAWIAPHDGGYTLTVEPDAGSDRERVATVRVATAVEAADLALTWLADAPHGRFTIRCPYCRTIARQGGHHCTHEGSDTP